ncbi:ATP-binding protein [Belnapia rosea]|uniref:ATP-binding protein n=1 Tax=Belnapia rosea TaxID=938405 RepID=UPI0008851351|nr:ATP-binding protein [Belnapia rosea]SDB37719.1 two-component system, OmpR family, phosphate regulon sensor histidine kinase PhoR [Belnapia rosea]
MAPPPLGRVIAAAGLIGAVPALVLLLLLAEGELAPGPGALALLACLLAALAVAQLWIGNLARLAEALRRAAAADGRLVPPDNTPLLPAVAEIAEGVDRLARRLADQGELVGRLRRADEAIVERLPDPLLVLSPERRPLRANAAARALFGAAGGGPPRDGDVAALLRHPMLAAAVDRALAERQPQTADLVLPVPVVREIAAQVIPMEPELADGGRIVIVLSDRSRERAVERMRADFVANASHELRTPLASLIGFIETLRGPAEDDPAARQRFLGIMAEQSERMRRLIDDLLGLSRIELTEHQPPTGQADVAGIARAEADALEPLFRARGVTLSAELEPGAMATPADGEQVAQVLRNLLENAVRHGREGGAVRLSVARCTGGPRLPARPGVLLTVLDDGPGIPAEHIPRLTERFYRIDRGRSRSAGGTGLGLAIVKHIVNRHRGLLLIESEPAMGACFKVWLPSGASSATPG